MTDSSLMAHPSVIKSASILIDAYNAFPSAQDKAKAFQQLFKLSAYVLNDLIAWEDIIPAWKDNACVPSLNAGIDAMSLDMKTAYIIVFRDGEKLITLKELAEFVLTAYNADLRQYVVIRNDDSVLADLSEEKDMLSNLKIVSVNARSALDDALAKANEIIEMSMEVKVADASSAGKELTLRDYQRKALEACITAANDKSLREFRLCMPCGTGKTFMIGLLVAIEKKKRFCIFTQSLLMMEQTARIIQSHNIPVRMIGGDYKANEYSRARVTVCVYNSAVKAVSDYDVIIVDEGHHIYVPDIYDTIIIDKVFTGVIQSMKGFKLFMSATLDEWDFKIELRDMIERRYLSDYVIVLPLLPEAMQGTKEDADIIKTKKSLQLLQKYQQFRKVLAYCNTRKSGRAFNAMAAEFGIESMFFDGDTPVDERIDIIDQFENGTVRMLVTVRVLREGVDIPCADTCMFVEGRGSRIEIIQCVGRALRLYKNKPLAHVILPCFDRSETLVPAKIVKALLRTDYGFPSSDFWQTSRLMIFDCEKKPVNVKLDSEICKTILMEIDTVANACEWDERFKELRTYVTKRWKYPTEKNSSLGIWVSEQRDAYIKGGLTSKRIWKLESLPRWDWNLPIMPDGTRMKVMPRYLVDPSVTPTYKDLVPDDTNYWSPALAKACDADLNCRVYRNVPTPAWMKKFMELKRVVESEGIMGLCHKRLELVPVYQFYLKVMRDQRNKKLKRTQIILLETLPGWKWD